jgi:hypothetical protein
LKAEAGIAYSQAMFRTPVQIATDTVAASTPSLRTLHAEMLRLCARIGYSPPPSR